MALGPDWHDLGLVFDRGDGRLYGRETLPPMLRRAATRAGVPYLGFHALRHAHATLELARGTHPKIVQTRLGHSTIAMTLDLYSHASPVLERDAADRLEADLLGDEGEAASAAG